MYPARTNVDFPVSPEGRSWPKKKVIPACFNFRGQVVISKINAGLCLLYSPPSPSVTGKCKSITIARYLTGHHIKQSAFFTVKYHLYALGTRLLHPSNFLHKRNILITGERQQPDVNGQCMLIGGRVTKSYRVLPMVHYGSLGGDSRSKPSCEVHTSQTQG